MFKKTKLNRIAIAVAMSVGMSTAAMAQETSSSIAGKITGPTGDAAVGTVLTIKHVPSGTVKTVVVNAAGQFSAKGLRVGGPYTVTVDSDKFEDATVDNVFLTLGETLPFELALNSQQNIERIAVTAAQVSSYDFGQIGPGTTFSLADLETLPSADRDIKDIVRLDPRISISEDNGDESIICGGSHPRFSSLTVDGVRMNDSFGLNANGYPTTRMPFSFDAIDQVAVEIAPFDVQYGGFTGCNVNAVTKSGTNEIHGGVFFDYTSDSLSGDKIGDDTVDRGDYTVKRYGFNVGFPLLEDTLFGFVSYEKLEGAQIFDYAAVTGGAVSMDEVNRAIQIARDVYNYDAGGMPASAPVEDEKLLIKLDWNINEDHRASLVYNYNDGFLIDQSDDRSSNLTLSNHFYKKGAQLDSIVASVYSDWTDNFSTEVRIGRTKLDNTQESTDAASGFGEVQISSLSGGGTIFLGPDDSRQSNDLDWENTTLKIAGTYYLDEHTITGGYENENLDIYNLFMQHTIGEYRFGGDRNRNSSSGTSGLDDFEAGIADDVYYNNSAGTNNPIDAAATFSYSTHAAYVQDEWVIDDLTLMYGLRYDWITSSDKPKYNALFEDRYGFSNQATFDGKDLLQPRFGFNWSAADNLEFRGGFGLYSGGNPNVWLSNSYSNDGVTNIDTYRGDINILDAVKSGAGNAIYDPIQAMVDQVTANNPSAGSEPSTNAVDPNFEMPSEWKYNAGVTYSTEDEYIFSVDFLHAKKQDSATIVDLSIQQTGDVTIDGRPIYEKRTLGADEVTRNSRYSDLMLTNAKADGSSTTISFAVKKEYDFGLDVQFGYAYNESEDYNPMTSSVAYSNFTNIAVSDQNDPGVGTSNYEIPHNFTLSLRYSAEFVDGYKTRFSMFANRKAGRNFSYSFDNFQAGTDLADYRSLLYVPTMDEYGSKVTFESAAVQQDFDAFIASAGLEGYRGQIVPRNSATSSWATRVDFRIDQDLPGFFDGHNANAFLVIKNLGNMLNSDWGIQRRGPFNTASVVEAELNDDGTYTYSDVNPNVANESAFATGSLWEVRLGVKYNF
ncbi:TonB-dependent receptor [Aliiglaciecola sp. LCG003]|uniref:TonB-dependent receptor n=1 Tax=Aliiglaciecola sp. LCG003 TaxID=3053655 RepID=UPI0025727ABD|nr:TonB-dependent receptor [Aliiglaciecola sp. LCG003]WJG08809.1 TonB-dependent receptor [Aliiglaciecola sp. LCG003]